ncbi:MAG: adenylosuccinate synthase [Chitinispirillaceae bacterium]|nr:adenylosuccinate synthase [Chitinispirillaceae bacterium]
MSNMSNAVVVGTQWGDEGKAKVIDYLADRSDLVIRFQGGANAGHTVIANRRKFIFHLVPSGIMYPDKVCIVGNGVAFDAEQFLKEVDELDACGISVAERLFVSDAAHLVLPYHKSLDTASESFMGKEKIGTTGRGIGPAYSDKIFRVGIRVGDLVDADRLTEKIKNGFERHRALAASIYKADFPLSLDEIIHRYAAVRQRMLPFIDDTAFRIFEAYSKGKRLLFEGAQGTFLDIDHGTYPFVTSANTVAGCAFTGSGIGPAAIDHVIGIVKTYTTRVGNGPFPTELDNATGEMLRKEGGEFGATTGRPRRCGWFDTVMVRRAVQLNGLTHLVLTKLDVLNKLEEIPICTHYEIRGKRLERFPSNAALVSEAIPVYETMPGWKSDIAQCRSYGELPLQARTYIERIREICYNIPVLIVSVGPERRQTIEVTPLT